MAINSDDEFWNLLEIVETENGITELPNEYKVNGKYNFLDYKNVYSKETLTNFKHNNLPKINIFEKDKNKFYTSKQNSIAVTWSSETNKDVFQATFIETIKPFILNGFSKLLYVKKEYDVLPKWLTWYLNYDFSIQKQRESIPYTTRCNMTKNEMKNIKIKKVPLNVQQEIINIIEPKEQLFLKYHNVVDISDLDKFKKTWSNLINIIEPFEKLKEQINNKKESISKICYFEIINSKPQKTMIENKIIFEKGKNVNSIDLVNDVTNLPFINVSAINNKINKYISNPSIKKNIEYGDVILSLDGTIGLVNNFLEGYNGYGYKVFSKNNIVDNSIIYFSLLNPINQKIILENSNGSVIKHASKAKNKILLFHFLNENLIKIVYKYEIILKKIERKINQIIEKLINLFVI